MYVLTKKICVQKSVDLASYKLKNICVQKSQYMVGYNIVDRDTVLATWSYAQGLSGS